MELILTRIAKKKSYTIGRLSLTPSPSPKGEGSSYQQAQKPAAGLSTPLSFGEGSGERLLCDTLEPPVLEQKSRVSMDAVMRSPRKAQALKPFAIPPGRYPVLISYSPKMKQWLPILLGVPMFRGIRIHAGNTVGDTQGCILVGDNSRKGMVLNSLKALTRVKQAIVEAKERGESVWITIR